MPRKKKELVENDVTIVGRGKLNPDGNAKFRRKLDKKLARPALRGHHSRTMTRVSGYDKNAPDPRDEEMKVGETYNDVIFFKVIPSDRRVGISEQGIVHVPANTAMFFSHKDGKPGIWHGLDHYHNLLRVNGKQSFHTNNVDLKLFL